MKKLIALALVAAVIGTSLVGCGGPTTTKAATEAKKDGGKPADAPK